MTRRVLVTGATGFIGRHALPILRNAGFEVHALGRGVPEDHEVRHHAVDLLDSSGVARALAEVRASHLLHLAWYAEPGLYWTSPVNLEWVGASLGLLRGFAEAGGGRAVLIGTCAEYLWGAAEPFDETASPIAPATLYGVAKDALRRVALAYGEAAPMSVAWGRVFYIYGPHEKTGRLVSDAALSLLAGRPFDTTIGTQQRDFTHVEDIAGAVSALLASDVRGPVNIASGEAPPVRHILNLVAQEVGASDLVRFGARPSSAGEPKLVGAHVARLLDEVGFRPRWTLEGGIADTVAWWRDRRTV